MKRLAIITTHPVQYYAPVFRLLAERGNILIKVFYTWERGSEQFDEGFGKLVSWDLPLLNGYEYEFVSNNGNQRKSFWDIKNPTLNDTIKNWNADVILVFGWNYLSHLKAMRYFKNKIPVTFRGDSTLIGEKRNLKSGLRKVFLSYIYRYIDYAFYVGMNNKRYYIKFGLHESNLIFTPHAIDNKRFQAADVSNESFAKELKNKLSLKGNDIVILFAGKLQSIKNVELLINAIKKIQRQDVHLLIVGNGNKEISLKELASDTPNIHFLPFQNQTLMPVIYNLAHIFSLPSKRETWGLAVNEAMACGKPILVSDKVGCAIDLVKKGENGYIFESDNIDDLIEKLNFMLNLKKIDEMGIRSKEIISSWNFENIAIPIEAFCRTI